MNECKETDFIFEIFNNQVDTDNADIVDAMYFLAKKYDFPLNDIPTNLYSKIINRLNDDHYESFLDDCVKTLNDMYLE